MNILEILGFKTRKKCRFCQRTLRGRASIKAGFGPVCGKKNAGQLYAQELERQGQMNFFQEKVNEHPGN